MNSAGIAHKLARKTLREPNFERALRFTLSYLEGLKVFRKCIDEELIILELSELDSRFLDGYCKELIFLPTEKFNPNGSLFIGKVKNQEIRKSDSYGILQIRGKGL